MRIFWSLKLPVLPNHPNQVHQGLVGLWYCAPWGFLHRSRSLKSWKYLPSFPSLPKWNPEIPGVYLSKQRNPNSPHLPRCIPEIQGACLGKWGKPDRHFQGKRDLILCGNSQGTQDHHAPRECHPLSHSNSRWDKGWCVFHPLKQISCTETHPSTGNLLHLMMSVSTLSKPKPVLSLLYA